MRPECGSPPGGFFWGCRGGSSAGAGKSARRHNANGAAGRARRAQGTRKCIDPIGCIQSIKAAQNALQRHCGRCSVFCGHSRSGAGISTARENGRRRGERAPGVHWDGREALRDAGRLLGRSGAARRDRGTEKAPDGSGAGDYLKRRAAPKSVASGSRSRNKTGMRSPPVLLYHIRVRLSRGQASVKRLETVSRLYWLYSSAWSRLSAAESRRRLDTSRQVTL